MLVFLNSAAASYITGQVIWVDGGSVAERLFGDISDEERSRWNMASWSDFRRVADDVRNWGRWGDADELGTLNLITAEKVAAGREPGQARQGLSAGRRLRLVGSAGRVPLPAEPAARDDDRRRRRRARWPSTARSGCRTRRPTTAQRVLRRRPDALQRRRHHHAAAGGHPVGRAVARLLRGQALQRLPGGLGDQPRRVPLRHRQGGRQGHHVPRCAARHRAPARCRDVLRTRRPDHARRTRRGGARAGRHSRQRRHRAGPDRLVGKVSGDRRRRGTGRGPGLDVRVVAARPRGRRGRRRQPDGREPGRRASRAPSCRCTCCACATWG